MGLFPRGNVMYCELIFVAADRPFLHGSFCLKLNIGVQKRGVSWIVPLKMKLLTRFVLICFV